MELEDEGRWKKDVGDRRSAIADNPAPDLWLQTSDL